MELAIIMTIMTIILAIRDQGSKVAFHQLESFRRNQDYRLQTGQPGVGGEAGEPDEGVDVDVYVGVLFGGAMCKIGLTT